MKNKVFLFLDQLEKAGVDYNQKVENVMDEFGVSKRKAEGLVCDWIQGFGR